MPEIRSDFAFPEEPLDGVALGKGGGEARASQDVEGRHEGGVRPAA